MMAYTPLAAAAGLLLIALAAVWMCATAHRGRG